MKIVLVIVWALVYFYSNSNLNNVPEAKIEKVVHRTDWRHFRDMAAELARRGDETKAIQFKKALWDE